jgi:hypothetical protein
LLSEEDIKVLMKGNNLKEIVLNMLENNGIEFLDAFTKLRKA